MHAGLKRMPGQVLRRRHSAPIGRLEFADRQDPLPGRHVNGIFGERNDLTGSESRCLVESDASRNRPTIRL